MMMVKEQQQAGHDLSRDLENEITEQKTTPLPRMQLLVLLYLQLAEPITGHVMLPFIVQLIEETGITGDDVTKVGYYAGLVESLFFLAEALLIFQWGRLSDRVGRRPVLLTGIFGLGLSMLCFGLSHTFWAVVASRAVAGALNGNTGVMKCMISEMTDETNIAQAFSILPIVWAVGNTIAPLLGGWLQHPYERFGGVFHRSLFWKKNPYFLPCMIVASYSASAFVVGYFLLKETAPVANRQSKERPASDIAHKNGASSSASSLPSERSPLLSAQKKPPTSLRALLTPRVLVVILNYSVFAINDISFVVLQPLFFSTPISHGGLGMEPSTIGVILAALGIANGTASVLFFPWLNRRFGTKRLLTSSALSFVFIFPLYPVMNALARAHGGLGLGVWIAFGMQLTLVTLPPMGFGCIFMYLTSAPDTRSELGATNGLAQTTISITRAIGPAAATSLFALTMERELMGGLLIYVILCVLGVGAVVVTRLLPEKPWRRAEG